MKLNWGHKLAISMALFICFVVFLGIRMWANLDSIEEDDYYAKGQKYEQQIEKEKNTAALKALPLLEWNPSSGFSVSMPTEMKVTAADLLLYKPDASDKDKRIDVNGLLSNSSVVVPIELEKGKWIAKFEWTSDGKAYYMEKIFFVEK